MSAHAFLAPSAAHRWVHCPFAPTLEAQYPETEPSPASLEGTAAHEVAGLIFQGTPPEIGQQMSNGVAVTQEMIEGGTLLRDEVWKMLGPESWPSLKIEQPIKCSRVHSTLCEGTPDVRGYIHPALIPVWDYKYGFEVVEAFENWQLIAYAAGVMDELGIDGLADQHTVFDLCVVQPRAPHRLGPVRHWKVKASDLRPYVNRLRNAAEEAASGKARAVPTPDGCKYCAGRHACEALQREAFNALAHSQQGAAFELSPHALGLEARTLIRAQSLLAARVSGLEAQIEATLRTGGAVPFWVLQSEAGRLKWKVPDEQVRAVGQMFGKDLTTTEVVTPAQAVKAGIPEATVRAFAERPTSMKLRQDDGTKARLTFSTSVA